MSSKLGGTASGAASGAATGATVGGPYGALAGGIIGGAVGFFGSSSEDEERAKAAAQAAFDEIMSLNAPPKMARDILLRNFEQAGVLTPEMEQMINFPESTVAQIQEDPRFKEAQVTALQQWKERASTGMTPEEYALMNKMRNEAERATQAQQQSILQRAQATGTSGSGNELAAQLLSSQASANREMEGGLEIGAQASRNALEALRNYGSMAGDVRAQDFGVAKDKAAAKDAFAKLRTDYQAGLEQRNVASRNAAQKANIGRQQQVSDANISQANQEELRKLAAEGEDWQNEAKYRSMRAGAYGGQQNFYNQEQAKKDAELKGILSSAQQLGSGLSQSGFFNKKPKYDSKTGESLDPDFDEETGERIKFKGPYSNYGAYKK